MRTEASVSRPIVAPLDAARSPEGANVASSQENLRRGIIATEVSPRAALLVTCLFLVLIYGVPVAQIVLEKSKGEDLIELDLFRHLPTKERLRQFEDDLEQGSYAKELTQPRAQALLTKLGRVGNKKAVVGLGGWLYYTPGITYLGGPGFLEADTIENRRRASLDTDEGPVHADPRPAIFAFHEALAKRNIALILFPAPDKAMLQPLQLHGRGRGETRSAIARNRDWDRFIAEMQAHDIAVFDPTPVALASGEAPRYLVQDTHWTAAWMEEVAGRLSEFVIRRTRMPPLESPLALSIEPRAVARVGDIADMLKLPEGQTIFLPQTITIHQVIDGAGQPWEPAPEADILLLGDSFTNIFSLDQMGWGENAGLAPHLARALGRNVDVIAQNDSGAFATRQNLARALAGGEDRLAGKKVVIWEFASRELAVGDWKPVDWDQAMAKGADTP